MSDKPIRQKRIMELVQREAIRTQEEMIAALKRVGLRVSQATLSADLKEMGIARVPGPDGEVRYRPPVANNTPQRQRILARELQDFLVGMDNAGNILVLKTVLGNAQGVCAAIDSMGWPEILGTLAGEDTILILSKTVGETEMVMRRIREVMEGHSEQPEVGRQQ